MKQANTNAANKVQKLNLDAIAKKLSNVNLEVKKERVNLYIYPAHLKTEKDRNSKEGKAFRSSLRRKLDNFANSILILVKYNRTPEISPAIKEFKKFYKENYRINDFTVNSVSQRKDEKNELIKMLFETVLYFDAKEVKKEKKTPVKKEDKKELPAQETQTV